MLHGASPSVGHPASPAMPTTSHGGIVAPPHRLADGVSVGLEAPSHRLADDGYGLRVRPVGVIGVAPAEELGVRRVEEPGIDRGSVRDEGAVSRRRFEPAQHTGEPTASADGTGAGSRRR